MVPCGRDTGRWRVLRWPAGLGHDRGSWAEAGEGPGLRIAQFDVCGKCSRIRLVASGLVDHSGCGAMRL
jgi:hypothetical protein